MSLLIRGYVSGSQDMSHPSTPRQFSAPGKPALKLYRRVRRWPLVPLALIVLIAVCAVFAPLLTSYDPTRGVLLDSTIPPAWYAEGNSSHWLGTDPLGRDLLSRIIYGARVSMIVAAVVIVVGSLVGASLGLIAGYFGGHVDEAIMRVVDFTFAVPFLLVALVVVIVTGPNVEVIILLLIFFSWNAFARQVRGEALQIRTRDYVAIAKIAGASPVRIMYRHMLPGVINTIIIIASLRVGTLILTEATLSYLGVGVPPPTPAWGSMISDGRTYLGTAWWVSFFPGCAIVLTVISFNFLGDWVRDRLDPKLRQM